VILFLSFLLALVQPKQLAWLVIGDYGYEGKKG